MIRTVNANSGDLFSLPSASSTGKTQQSSNAFKMMLEEALLPSDPPNTVTSPSNPVKPDKKYPDNSVEEKELHVIDDPGSMPLIFSQGQQQPESKSGTATEAQGETAVQATTAQTAGQAAIPALPQQGMPILASAMPQTTQAQATPVAVVPATPVAVVPATSVGQLVPAQPGTVPATDSELQPMMQALGANQLAAEDKTAQKVLTSTLPFVEQSAAAKTESQERLGGMLETAQQKLTQMKGTSPPEQPLHTTAQKEASTPTARASQIQQSPTPADAKTTGTVPQAQSTQPETTGKVTTVQPRTTEPKLVREEPKQDYAAVGLHETATSSTQRTAEPVQTQRFTQATPPTQQAEQIRVQVAENLKSANMEFRMQLQPEELGKLDVKMVIAGGRLAVEIIAAGTHTADLLQKQMGALASSLRMHTNMEIQSIQVVTEAQASDSHMDGAFNMLGGQTQNGAYEQQNQSGTHTTYQSARQAVQEEQARLREGQARDTEAPQALLDYAI